MARIACTKPGGLNVAGYMLNGPQAGEEYGETFIPDVIWQTWYAADGNNHSEIVTQRTIWQLPPT